MGISLRTPAPRDRRRRAIGLTRGVLSVSAAMVAISGWQVLRTATADAAVDAGRPQVIVPLTPATPTSGEPLDAGGSGTPFSLALIDGAACTGDSAADNYRVQTYIVPQSVDPATLKFDGFGPTPQSTGTTHRQPLYDVETTPYVDAQTANADTPGGPGRIINLPAFAFGNGVWSVTDLPPGAYNVGVACTLGTSSEPDQLDRYFNTVVQIVADAEDPGGFTFMVADNDEPTGVTTSTTSTTAASSTTSTTAGSSSTTSTTASGSSSTTSTTASGGSSTSSSTSTTVSSSSSSSSTIGGSSTSTPSGALGTSASLPRTGAAVRSLLFWGLALCTSGALLLGWHLQRPVDD